MYYTIDRFFCFLQFFRGNCTFFADININSFKLFSVFSSLSFNNLIYFPCHQTSTYLSTDTQTSATSIQFCSSSIAPLDHHQPHHCLDSTLLHHLLLYLHAQSVLYQHQTTNFSFQCFTLVFINASSLNPQSMLSFHRSLKILSLSK